MQHQVHRTDSKHCLVSIKAVEHFVAVMVGLLFFQQFLLMMFLDELSRFHDESSRTHSWVAHSVVQVRLHHINHHSNDMARSTELTVVTACGHLAQHILVHIAHRVAVIHIKTVDPLDNLDQRTSVRNQEVGVIHKAAVSRFLTVVQRLDEHERILRYGREHRFGFPILEYMPAETFIGNIPIQVWVVPLAGLEYWFLDLDTHRVRRRFLFKLAIV